MHVRVGADAGVAEEVPRAADRAAGLEDLVAGPGAVGLEVMAGTDAGQAGPDDEHVEVGAAAHFRRPVSGSGPTPRVGRRCQTPVPIELSLTEPSTSEDPVLSGFHQLRGLAVRRLARPARGASRRARCFMTLTLTLDFGE